MKFTIVATTLVACLPAQTFVVDAANGPGTHFTSIAAAVAAVPDGAVLLVRAGAYAPFSILAKGLTVLGDPGVGVFGAGSIFGPGTIDVRATLATQPVTLRGLELSDAFGTMSVDGCQGPVLIEAVTRQAFCNCTNTPPAMLQVMNSAQVTLRDCTGTRTSLLRSNALLENCTLGGYGAICAHGSCSSGAPAVDAAYGTTQVVGCTLTGGAGGGGVFYPLQLNHPAIACFGGDLRVLAPCTLIAGNFAGAPAVEAINGTGNVRIDPLVSVQSAVVPPVAGASVATLAMPSVRSDGAPPGGQMTAAALGPFGSVAVLLVGLPGLPIHVPGIGDAFWIDAAAYRFAAFGVPQSGAPVAAALSVPNVVAFAGFRVAWQSVSAIGQGLEASNPSTALVR